VSTGDGAAADEAGIERLVRSFYGTVRTDPLLGPIFAAHVGDWETHIATLCDFWSGILLGTERYDGRPLAAHVRLRVEPRHFERWLASFRTAARDSMAPAVAELLIERANRIAQSFMHGIAASRGQLPAQDRMQREPGAVRS